MITALIVFFISLCILMWASRSVINNSIKLSEYYGFSQLAIGFILVALTVSLPDLMVSVTAAVGGNPDLGVGDALGSTVANICLVLGIATFVRRIAVERKHILDSTELLLLIGTVPALFLTLGTLGMTEGLVLLVLFLIYCFFVMKERFTLKLKDGVSKRDLVSIFFWFFLALFIVVLSSRYVVKSAEQIALDFGISEAILGLTLISFGTTLPELAVDFAAVRRGQTALAIGDILGSSVINLTLILGSVLVISPIRTNLTIFTVAISFVILSNTFLFYSLVKHESLGKRQGLIFLGMYVLFIAATLGSKIFG
jgi:cation:H+ antiporter